MRAYFVGAAWNDYSQTSISKVSMIFFVFILHFSSGNISYYWHTTVAVLHSANSVMLVCRHQIIII
jgi:hypothetical protein